MMSERDDALKALLDDAVRDLDRVITEARPALALQDVGTVKSIGEQVAVVTGLAGVASEELVLFPGNRQGLVLDVDRDEVGVVLLEECDDVYAGSEVTRTGRVIEIPVGESLIGRVVDPMGRPRDDQGPLETSDRLPIEREAPGIMDRAPVTVPLQTGLKVVDAMIPIGRGQRELILGDRQTGKTAVAIDTLINQKGRGVVGIYCAIGKRGSAAAKVVEELSTHGAMDYSVVIVTTAEEPAGLQYIAPYAATSVGEYFMHQGKDVLVVYDDLTCHARAYRELSLLVRRPPGREAYPGDIFYIHSRLLERSTHLRSELGGGSLTALPIIETEAQNISGYIPTNLISITDGQIYLSPQLFRKGLLPAVDVGKSVSRVGGKSQLNAYRGIVGDLKLAYSQFEELETFARFGTRMDDETQKTLERGRRVREILRQPQYEPIPVPEQIAVLVAVNSGVLDSVATGEIGRAQARIRAAVTERLPQICEKIESDSDLSHEDREAILNEAEKAITSMQGS